MKTAEIEKQKQELLEKRQYWWWAEKERSSRVDFLRKALWSKATKGSAFLPGIKVCTHQVKVAHEVLQQKEAIFEPFIKTWAKILAKNLATIPIFIVDKSRIVGYTGAAPHMVHWTPLASYSINEDVYNDRMGLVDDEERPVLKAAMDHIKPWTYQTHVEQYLTRREKINSGMALTYAGAHHTVGDSYPTPQYDWWLPGGYTRIIEVLEKNIADAKKTLHETVPNAPEQLPLIEKIDNWEAGKMVLEAAIKWARRYARLARIIAENFESDAQRKSELLRIAETCDKVPAHAPEHFWEAIQFDIFRSTLEHYESQRRAWPNRPDNAYFPYYKRSVVDDKVLSEDEALEYVCEWQLRAFEYGRPWSRLWREILTGDPGPWVWTLGGQDKDGNDSCNDLTDMFLKAARLTRVVSPTYAFRYHRNVRIQTLKQVFECIRHGLGYPNIRNDDVLIDSMHYWAKVPIEEARTWIVQACIVPCAGTKKGCQPISYATSSTIASKALELALYNGYDPISRMQLGPKTGDPATFTLFDQLYDAFLEQYKYFTWEAFRVREIGRHVEMTKFGRPFLGAILERCVESGENHARSKEYGNPWLSVFAWMDQLDALAAVKKLVYEDKKYTMAQMIDALKANWEGSEEMRMDFVRAPKWGNDDDYVDDIVVRAHKDVRDKVCLPTREYSGVPWSTAPQNVAAYIVASTKVGALPNGRRLGDTMYDGGCSPGAGLDKKGPTAVLRSAGKLDHRTFFKANLLNQRLSPAQLAGDKGFELWHSYIKTWRDLGCNQVQFNMVDNETLFAAQKEPEKYSELIVRVAGYSAHFVELNKKAQDTIIARTVQNL